MPTLVEVVQAGGLIYLRAQLLAGVDWGAPTNCLAYLRAQSHTASAVRGGEDGIAVVSVRLSAAGKVNLTRCPAVQERMQAISNIAGWPYKQL